MGQKVNPISLRLEKTNRHFDSCWYDDYNYTDLLLQDLKIKNHLKTVLDQIQYPEGRVLIENLPKKTNINLFYYNPTNSRRKKNIRFQLQNFKENKRKDNRNTFYKNKNIIRFQPGIEKKEFWKNSLNLLDYRFFGRDFNDSAKKPTKTTRKKLSIPLGFSGGNEKLNNFQLKEYKSLNQDFPLFIKKTKGKLEQREGQYCGVPSLSVNFKRIFNPFLNTLSYKSGTLYNINKLFLQFILYTPKNKEIGGKWERERFFVRYHICFFYCKFLQNKKYTLYNTLYAILSLSNPVKSFQKNTETSLSFFHKNFPKNFYSGNQIYKSHLECSLSKQYHNLFNLFFFRSLIGKQGANLLVQEIIYYLERKIPFRRIKTSLLREIPQYTCIKGIRINCSGRVGGRSKKAQRSKTQSVKIGQSSLGVFSCKIDFACKSAKTRFGLIGVKVWICYQ